MKKYIPLMIGMVLPLIAAACGPDNDQGMTNVTLQLIQQETQAGSDLDLGAIPDYVHYLKFQIWESISTPQAGEVHNYFVGDEENHANRVDITDYMRQEGYVLVGFYIPNGLDRRVSIEAYEIFTDPESEDMVVYSGFQSGIDLTGEPITVPVDMVGP